MVDASKRVGIYMVLQVYVSKFRNWNISSKQWRIKNIVSCPCCYFSQNTQHCHSISPSTCLLFPLVCVDFQWWCFWMSQYTSDTLYLLFPPYETCNLSLAFMSTRSSILATSSCCCLDVQYKAYWWSVQGTRILLRLEVSGTLSLFYPGIISVTLEELFLTYFLTCRMRWGSQGEFLAFLCRWVFATCGFCTRCHPSNSKLLSLGNCRGC